MNSARILKYIYFTLCAAVLVGAVYLFEAWAPRPGHWQSAPIVAAGTLVMFLMNVLAFPIGLIWELLFRVAVRPILGAPWQALGTAQQLAVLFVYWVVHLLLGYVQWFVVVPRAIRLSRQTRSAS